MRCAPTGPERPPDRGVTTIDFYFNAADRVSVACRLAGKAVQQQNRVLVYAPEPELAQKVDRTLWTFQAVSFVPHCLAGDALAQETPVLICSGDEAHGNRDVLINLGRECPPFFARHARLLEIVTQDEAERQAGRDRYAFYKARGYALRNHDLAAEKS
jgi:DNA polymerase III subunit chi